MMLFEPWLAYCGAAALVLIIPGPTIRLVISCEMNQRRNAAVGAAATLREIS